MIRLHPLLLPFLIPVSWLYRGAVALRNTAYDRGLAPRHRLDRPVVSIGNLTVGGSGKTPFAETCARILTDTGLRPAVLSRGYGRESSGPVLVSRGEGPLVSCREGGDEPVLLARRVPGLAVAVAEDRLRAGQLLLEEVDPPPEVFLLDDGFQHRRLHRDLDLVLAPATELFGNGRLLPAGPLREPLSSLGRADALVLTGGRRPGESGKTPLTPLDLPLIHADLEVEGLRDLAGGTAGSAEVLRETPVAAFAGIARPEGFFGLLRQLGAELVLERGFRDHHPYRREDLEELHVEARRAGAELLLTTEKDAVRLAGLPVPATPPAVRCLAVALAPRQADRLRRLLSGAGGEPKGDPAPSPSGR